MPIFPRLSNDEQSHYDNTSDIGSNASSGELSSAVPAGLQFGL